MNFILANPGKFQMLVLGARNTVVEISVGNVKISPTDSVELLGIIIISCMAEVEWLNIKETRRLKVENFALIATYGALYERITRWNEIKVDKTGKGLETLIKRICS